MKTIGFANIFYTLWDVTSETQYSQTPSGQYIATGITHKHQYQQKLAKDLDRAKKRAFELTGQENIAVDETLRGHTRYFERHEKIEVPVELFPYGKLYLEHIATSDDVWQLNRTWTEDSNRRRRVIARRRLIELGELIRYPHTYTEVGSINSWEKYQSYATPKFAENDQKPKMQHGHFHQNGSKQTLTLTVQRNGGFDGQYGWCAIQTFTDSDMKVYTYMGSSPQKVEEGETVTMTATIKHNWYNGQAQTKLMRIKVLDSCPA